MNDLAVKEAERRVYPITVDMYHLMAEHGVFHPEDRVELIGGEIHTQAKETGYSLVTIYNRGERLSSGQIPLIDLLVDDVLGGSPSIS